MTPRIWAKYAWLAHLLSVVFLAGVAYAGVASQSVRIDKLEATTKDMPASLARIEQAVNDMHSVIYKERP